MVVSFNCRDAYTDQPQRHHRLSTNPTPLPGLTTKETNLLCRKQLRLRTSAPEITALAASYGPHITTALKATFIFTQHEAGTAVCVGPRGWILTCAHCFGESEEEWKAEKLKWLHSYEGIAVHVECVVWDCKRDLALARVVSVESEPGSKPGSEYTFIPIPLPDSSLLSSTQTYTRTPILCTGQPGADDLEGLIRGSDRSLKHDAWTYWGHSGALLVCSDWGVLLGLHSSWDDETAMRHGVPGVAVVEFLGVHLPGLEEEIIVVDSD
ncbi:hypothetical protein BJX70DRAFT_390227 [Aspergillus crustosus]